MTLLSDRPTVGTIANRVSAVTKYWWLGLITGTAWLIVSLMIFRFDYTTVAAVSVLFGFVALAAGLNEFLLAGATFGRWRFAHVALGAIFTVVGFTSFAQPWSTFVGLAAMVSFFLVFRGTFDLVQAFSLTGVVRGSWLLILAGIAEIGLGFWAAGSWKLSVVLLVAWVGATAMLRGITEITAAFATKELHDATK